MRGKHRDLVLLSCLALGAGCSLIVDTGPYVGGENDGGSPDGNVDATVVADPTPPVVGIQPASPSSSDDLTVTIETESIDPLEAGAISYEYRWTSDGEDTALSTETVPSTETATGQLWRVEVTGISADGRRGMPGAAEVTIGNLAPTLAFLGLDSYRPIQGEELQAIVGPVEDPDGDAVAIEYTWYADDVPIPDVSGPRLSLTPELVAVGASIRVEATPTDMMDVGASLEAGPAIVLADITRWRQLLPNRTFRERGLVAFDPPNRRLLLIDQSVTDAPAQVWEHGLDRADGRFVQLFPSGTPGPLTFPSVAYDEVNRRLLFFGGVDLAAGGASNELYALNLSKRGSERWEQLSPTGDGPSARFGSTMAYDGTHHRILLFGGVDESGVPMEDLWSLDVSAAGFESWSPHGGPSPGPLAGANLVIDSSRSRGVLIGGLFSGTSAVDTIYTVNLESLDDGFVASGSTLPSALSSANSAYDQENDRFLVAFGRDGAGVASSDVYAIDAESLSVTRLSTTGGPASGGNGVIASDPYSDRMIVFPGAPNADATRTYDVYSLAGSAFEPIHRYGVDVPIAVTGAAAGYASNFEIFGGETLSSQTTDHLIRFDVRRGTWSQPLVAADAITGRSPNGRGRLGTSLAAGLSFFGGYSAPGLTDTVLWSLNHPTATETEWVERTLLAGATPVEPREWPAIFETGCLAGIGFFGGRTSAGPSNDTGILSCSGGVRECTWADHTAASRPSPRYGAAVARLITDVVVFGGNEGSSLASDVWTLTGCAPDTDWVGQAPTGAAPPSRWSHTMNREGSAAAVSALMFGGAASSGDLGDVHRLVRLGTNDYRWELVEVPTGPTDAVVPPRHGHVAAYDESNSRLLVYGGTHGSTLMSDFWELRVR